MMDKIKPDEDLVAFYRERSKVPYAVRVPLAKLSQHDSDAFWEAARRDARDVRERRAARPWEAR